MIAVATTVDEVSRVSARLRDQGAIPENVVAPSEIRRVVLAQNRGHDEARRLVASLGADGEMAVIRPDGGAELRAWFRDTRPITIRHRLTFCHAWSEHDRGDLPGLIELGPGGFGNGHHPTTRLLLEELVRRIRGGERVLDVGCGSGALGLGAIELGARRVVAVDLKAPAVDAARRNAALNGMGTRLEASIMAPGRMTETFDVIVANIARAGIVELAPDLIKRLAPAGWLAVSGISPAQCAPVAEFLRPLVEVQRFTSGEWSALVLAARPE